MALTNYYVDPLNGSDTTGNGTLATPWKSTQKALNTILQGAGGDRINIKAGADDVLTATLSLTTYGTPAAGKPLVFMGYTSSQDDGGIGGISGNSGGFSILTSSALGISFVNMHLHHTGASVILSLGLGSGFDTIVAGCEFDHSTSGIAVQCMEVDGCYFHDLSGTVAWKGCYINDSRFDGRNSCPSSYVFGLNFSATGNLLILGSASGANGIQTFDNAIVTNNSIYGNSGTGAGILDSNAYSRITNNIVEGFSGAGGVGYKSTNSSPTAVSAGNRSFNNTTHYSYAGGVIYQGTDYTDAASNFNSPSTGDLSLKSGSPARGVSYPGTYPGSPTQTSSRDAGALQHPEVTPATPPTPTLSVADKGDGTGATATITGGDAGASNAVYVAPLPSGTGNISWTQKATIAGNASGAVSLTPGSYLAYAEATENALYSQPSNTVVFRTTGGGLSGRTVTPTGHQGIFVTGVAYLIANSANFQALVGAPDAAHALPFVKLEADDTEESGSSRPRVIVYPSPQFALHKVALQKFRPAGGVWVSFELPPTTSILTESPREDRIWDEMLDFYNKVDPILNDCMALQGTSPAAPALSIPGLSQVALHQIELLDGPSAINEVREEGEAGEVAQYFYGATYFFQFNG